MAKRKTIDVIKVLNEAVILVSESISGSETQKIIEQHRNGTYKSFMPLGESCSYLFSYSTFSIIEIENTVKSVLGIELKDIVNESLESVFSKLIVPEHSTTATRFSKLVFETLEKYSEKDAVVNFEFDIYKPHKIKRRILNQYKILVKTSLGKPLVLQGYFTDITNLHPSGPPALQVVVDNKVIICVKGSMKEMLAGLDLDISERELNVLILKGQGLFAKEIAKNTGLTVMSVYSILRDIKRETNMDPIPLIELLKEKGLLK